MEQDYSMQLKLVHGFSNKTRYNILMTLKDGEKNVTDILTLVGGSQSSISQHLACLKDCGLIDSRSEGKFIFYRITTTKIVSLLDIINDTSEDFSWNESSIECNHHME